MALQKFDGKSKKTFREPVAYITVQDNEYKVAQIIFSAKATKEFFKERLEQYVDYYYDGDNNVIGLKFNRLGDYTVSTSNLNDNQARLSATKFLKEHNLLKLDGQHFPVYKKDNFIIIDLNGEVDSLDS